MSNGLEKFVDEQARYISDTQADQFKLAYNRGIMDLVRRRELSMLASQEQPTMIGGGSKTTSLKDGLVPLNPLPGNNSVDYATLVTGGRISRLKKATKWAKFSGDSLDRGLDLATKAKALGGDLDGAGKKKRKRKGPSIAAARDWASFASDAISTGIDKGVEVNDAMGGKKRKSKKGPSVAAARDWASFASDAISTGIDKSKEVQEALDGGKKKINHRKKAAAWTNFAVDTANKGLDIAQKVKALGAGKPRAPNAWVTHVKKYAADHGVSYKEAMSQAKSSYKK